jgi:hypothetical protein
MNREQTNMSLIVSNSLHPAESAHWYTKDGTPAYEVKAKNGQMRSTTLRDAKKYGYIPSVTTIIRCAASPGLDRWKQEQVLYCALTTSQRQGESEQDYLRRIMDDSREQGKKASERGTLIHAAIEGSYEGRGDGIYPKHVQGVKTALEARYGAQNWVAEKTFSSPLGFGGKTDLCAPGIVVDVKTKEFSPDNLPKAYDEHQMQLAAYRTGLGMSFAKCANIFVSATHPGLVHIHEWTEEDMEQGWEMFVSLLRFWYAKTKLDRLRSSV